MDKILVVAAHPDDETLGCGGSLLKHKSEGNEIYWLIMTNISVQDGYKASNVCRRQQEIRLAAKRYGFRQTFKLDFPTTKLDILGMGRLVNMVNGVIQKVKPNVVYLPNRNDIHSDHKVTFDAVLSSLKSFRCPSIKRILAYEIISETEFSPPFPTNIFTPNSFSDISEYLTRKIAIMKIYRGELGGHPFPRSIDNLKALATHRGATAGVKYAEAFMVINERW